jgi:hypothetical protein
MVEAAGVERELGAIVNCLMARDFWAKAFYWWHLPPVAHPTDVPEKHSESTWFLERYWRRREGAPAAGYLASQLSHAPNRRGKDPGPEASVRFGEPTDKSWAHSVRSLKFALVD